MQVVPLVLPLSQPVSLVIAAGIVSVANVAGRATGVAGQAAGVAGRAGFVAGHGFLPGPGTL